VIERENVGAARADAARDVFAKNTINTIIFFANFADVCLRWLTQVIAFLPSARSNT
jgi:hypothetical protein